jgi:ketosteroid isomerase-like protein
MKPVILVVMVLVGSLVLTNMAVADDAADVKAAVLAMDAAFSSGDVETIAKYTHPEHSRFAADGGLVNPGFTKAGVKAFFDTGIKLNVQSRHIEVKVFGNAAVVTYYTLTATTQPDGNTTQATSRDTEVWIKQGGNWKRVHIHSSPLAPAQ